MPFEELVRVLLDQEAIVECGRLGLVAVDAHERLLAVLRQEAPLQPGGEARAAPAAKLRVLDELDDLVRVHLGQGLARGPVRRRATRTRRGCGSRGRSSCGSGRVRRRARSSTPTKGRDFGCVVSEQAMLGEDRFVRGERRRVVEAGSIRGMQACHGSRRGRSPRRTARDDRRCCSSRRVRGEVHGRSTIQAEPRGERHRPQRTAKPGNRWTACQ